MATTSLKKVARGDPLRIPADTYNAFIDTTKDFLDRKFNKGESGVNVPLSEPNTILIKNTTGSTRNQFEVLAITGSVYNPSTHVNEFKNHPIFEGSLPDGLADERFVILMEPIANNGIAVAAVSGVVPTQIEIPTGGTLYYHARLKASSYKLIASPVGVPILWKESGTGASKWALVQLGIFGYTRVYFKITGATSIATNRWRYNGTEQEPIDGNFQDLSGGMTVTSIRNTIEAKNDGVGVEGHGVNVDGADYPAGFTVKPIATNAIVDCKPVLVDVSGTPTIQWWCQVVNADDGTCT